MVKSIKFFGSLDATKTKRAKAALERVPGLKIDWVAPTKFMDEIEDVPFIYTDEGDRYFGVDDIEYFVEGKLQAAQ